MNSPYGQCVLAGYKYPYSCILSFNKNSHAILTDKFLDFPLKANHLT